MKADPVSTPATKSFTDFERAGTDTERQRAARQFVGWAGQLGLLPDRNLRQARR